MIKLEQYLMGRDKIYPINDKQRANAIDLLVRVHYLFGLLRIKDFKLTSGYRPGSFNKVAGGAARSGHISCEAIDIADPDGSIDLLIMNNLNVLEECGLYLEHPDATPGWSHLQTRQPLSGNRVFRP
jgi:hypothetical protein